MAVTWLVFQVLTNGIFLIQRNLTLLALQTTITALAAISAVMLIVTRNFDLSVGSAVALVGVVVAWLTVRLDVDPLIAVPVAIVVGVALGAWNGWWVTRMGVPSFIVTLAGLLTFRGISLIITNSATISPVPKSMTGFATGFLPAAMSIALVCLLFGGYALFQVADARRAKAFGLIETVGPRVARMLIPAADRRPHRDLRQQHQRVAPAGAACWVPARWRRRSSCAGRATAPSSTPSVATPRRHDWRA